MRHVERALTRQRYVWAYWLGHGYVVWDCQMRVMADGVYFS